VQLLAAQRLPGSKHLVPAAAARDRLAIARQEQAGPQARGEGVSASRFKACLAGRKGFNATFGCDWTNGTSTTGGRAPLNTDSTDAESTRSMTRHTVANSSMHDRCEKSGDLYWHDGIELDRVLRIRIKYFNRLSERQVGWQVELTLSEASGSSACHGAHNSSAACRSPSDAPGL